MAEINQGESNQVKFGVINMITDVPRGSDGPPPSLEGLDHIRHDQRAKTIVAAEKLLEQSLAKLVA